ncbi:UNVERIFIED_CONTAM: hypothetical protein Slati_3065100 [Sesamum latifolium]|uniref:Uncharacterized protein n=1 Tax=Sesamum latifolium TaxID=2727402 RepID=A0AAW2UVD0_9LAMI
MTINAALEDSQASRSGQASEQERNKIAGEQGTNDQVPAGLQQDSPALAKPTN